jgi:hypothetical protein
MLRNSTRIAAAGTLLAGALALSAAAIPARATAATAAAPAIAPAIVAGGTIAVQYIPNEQAPMVYEMDNADHMSWMRTSAVPVQNVTTTGTATLAAGDLTTNHYVYRTISDAQKYDLPPNPDNMSSYQFMPGAQYISTHGDLNLAPGQTIGMVCRTAGGQLLAVFQNYIQGATHTWAAWLSAAEWTHATVTGGYLTTC